MEERIAGEDLWACEQPVVQLDLLRLSGMQFVPGVDAATRRTETRETKFCAVFVRKRFVGVDLFNVFASHNNRHFELTEVGIAQVIHCGANPFVGAFAAHGIVGDCIDAVERDLNVDVVHRRKALRVLGIDAPTVGGELHTNALFHAVFHDLEEIGAQHWFATADVHVEHLHLGELVNNGLHLFGRQLVGVATTR